MPPPPPWLSVFPFCDSRLVRTQQTTFQIDIASDIVSSMVVGSLKLWTDLVVEGFQKSLRVGKFLCLLHAIDTYVCTPVLPYGPSMLPTLNSTGDLVLVERVSTWLGKVGRGDMVLLRSSEDPRKTLIKRIVGVEGDTVTYLVDPKYSDASRTCVVPWGNVWVQGDYIYNSRDSRTFGAVSYGLVEGKLFWRIWPLKSFGSLHGKAKEDS
ncbi:mitochondrial inner membrane protease subunit 1-like isoform X2 [Rhodamnia argentea]|uniref:Mitochondrial inner membrane protease subunit 1-like isoform X2 n=1 Tax=Rhodamnia argentea TaxID=178133 RepID=A0A8B8MVR9_9MYRT|nr:mitochondrial inner membrane protease subunit 1-like isoform X2 [Rhodamnia argentea]XP_030514185.1 mitochondrial inner membrane protease subunit 1-like isoform X2 [Rhodamnia argentea]XP_030514187.1 mitochondrial inner membrane protease subunit 1-like isoform X2 [Rhodamnia argentea]